MDTDKQCGPSIAELWALLQEQRTRIEDQQEQIAALQACHERGEAELEQQAEKLAFSSQVRDPQPPLQTQQPAPELSGRPDILPGRISRSGVLKAAAAGIAGVAAAGLTGSLRATSALAASDTNFVATGGSGIGLRVGGASTTTLDYNYEVGAYLYGQTGLEAFAADANGNLGNGTGVAGFSGSGYGVQGSSHSNVGVTGTSNSGIGGYFEGGGAALMLAPAFSAGPPTTGSHSAGEIMVDSRGAPYISTASGTPGTWQAVGNFRSFSAPHRVFGDGTVLTAGTITAAIDVTGAGVPVGASSAYCAVQATNPGVMTLFPDGTTDPGIANWANTGTAGQLALVYMLVPLSSAGKFKIHTFLTGQIYVDVWGYLL